MLKDIEKYAIENKIPIIQKESLNYMLDYIQKNNINSVLEIGSAIGYSAIKMALAKDDLIITTLEKNEKMYFLALNNIKKLNLNNRIKVILTDALTYKTKEKFDLIFIDASKNKNLDFFQKFQYNLNSSGTIITDNINFHGLTNDVSKIKSRSLRSLVKKINLYVEFLKNNNEFTTEFLNIGDGLSISKKK